MLRRCRLAEELDDRSARMSRPATMLVMSPAALFWPVKIDVDDVASRPQTRRLGQRIGAAVDVLAGIDEHGRVVAGMQRRVSAAGWLPSIGAHA